MIECRTGAGKSRSRSSLSLSAIDNTRPHQCRRRYRCDPSSRYNTGLDDRDQNRPRTMNHSASHYLLMTSAGLFECTAENKGDIELRGIGIQAGEE
jgi:hypothetical protein